MVSGGGVAWIDLNINIYNYYFKTNGWIFLMGASGEGNVINLI